MNEVHKKLRGRPRKEPGDREADRRALIEAAVAILNEGGVAALTARGVGGPGRWEPVVEQARDYLHRALQAGESLGIGSGHGPVHHFAGVWPA